MMVPSCEGVVDMVTRVKVLAVVTLTSWAAGQRAMMTLDTVFL